MLYTPPPPAPPSALTLLSVITPTAAANVDALDVFSDTYSNFLVIGHGIKPAASDSLRLRFANAGAADAGANYVEVANTPGALAAAATTAALSGSVLASGKGLSFTLNVINARDAVAAKMYSSRAALQDAVTPTYAARSVDGLYLPANAISGLRLYWAGGNLFAAQGAIRIFGYSVNAA